ncbi:P-loop NTPase fold protein [Mangrovibacter sp. SLW1]
MAFERGYDTPIFILIDELDRCRPDYAISLLEIVKHIFDIKKFVFIIATDTDQLQHSIKNIYGNEFAANDYLGRFFHRRFTLKSPSHHMLIKEIISNKINNTFDEKTTNLYPQTKNIDAFSHNISSIYDAFGLNLRDSIRNTERFIDLLNAGTIKNKLDYILLIIIMIIYDKDRQILDKQTGKLPITENIIKSIEKSSKLKGMSTYSITFKFELDPKILEWTMFTPTPRFPQKE